MLGAIWGGSFLLQRIAVPSLQPIGVITWRVGLGAAFLVAWAMATRRRAAWVHWRRLWLIGVVNTAIPFFLFAVAARSLPAALLAVFNATAPFFAALIDRIWRGTPISRLRGLGLVAGFLGVVVLVSSKLSGPAFDAGGSEMAWALAAGLMAPFCYGLATTYIKIHASDIPPFDGALGSAIGAFISALPFYALAGPTVPTTTSPLVAVVILGVVCTGFAYLVAFRLVADVGPVRALTVTFLIPAFATVWGFLYGEEVDPLLFIGGPLILVGVWLSSKGNATGDRSDRREAR